MRGDSTRNVGIPAVQYENTEIKNANEEIKN